MCFLMQTECPCCRDRLQHCEKCWDKFHNGKRDNDYIPPKHFWESMSEGINKIMEEKYGIKMSRKIESDKKREYKEGEYH